MITNVLLPSVLFLSITLHSICVHTFGYSHFSINRQGCRAEPKSFTRLPPPLLAQQPLVPTPPTMTYLCSGINVTAYLKAPGVATPSSFLWDEWTEATRIQWIRVHLPNVTIKGIDLTRQTRSSSRAAFAPPPPLIPQRYPRNLNRRRKSSLPLLEEAPLLVPPPIQTSFHDSVPR